MSAAPSTTKTKPLPKELSEAKNLPSLPAVAMEVLRLSRSDRAEFQDYARILTKDPALAAKLLKLANSPMFGLPRPVTALQEATSVLGLRTVQIMAISFSLVGGLPKDGGCKSFRHDEFWRRSILFSVAARELAMQCDRKLCDEAFLCGVLSHIGQLVMAHGIPMQYERALRRCDGWPSAEDERRTLGFDHHQVADGLLTQWNIPDAIRVPVAAWGDPSACSDAKPETSLLCQVLAAAGDIVALAAGDDGGAALARLHGRADALGVTRQQLDTLVLVLEHRAHDAMSVLEMKLPAGKDHYTLLAEAREQMVELSLGAGAELKRSDRRIGALQNHVRRLQKQLTRDPLTGLSNREHMDDLLESEVETRRKGKGEDWLGLLRIRIDGFHDLVDSRGNAVGEEVLRVVAQAIGGTSRASDMPARTDEEEFAVIAPNSTEEGLRGFGERLRKFVGELEIHAKGRVLRATISVGGALFDGAKGDGDTRELFALAGSELAAAHEAGGDRVAIASTPVGKSEG